MTMHMARDPSMVGPALSSTPCIILLLLGKNSQIIRSIKKRRRYNSIAKFIRVFDAREGVSPTVNGAVDTIDVPSGYLHCFFSVLNTNLVVGIQYSLTQFY